MIIDTLTIAGLVVVVAEVAIYLHLVAHAALFGRKSRR